MRGCYYGAVAGAAGAVRIRVSGQVMSRTHGMFNVLRRMTSLVNNLGKRHSGSKKQSLNKNLKADRHKADIMK